MAEKVMAAMSGGVDSAAAAILLLDSKKETAGGTMIMYPDVSQIDVKNAAFTAEQLGIRHFVYDVSEAFKKNVMDIFARSYINGDTPNPCVICNKTVKFPEFIKRAEDDGFEKIATGHYARIEFDEGSKRWLLKKGKDKDKDQSYFLALLTQEILAKTYFPLGEMTKKKVRELTRSRNLDVATRKESQDICFLPRDDYRGFLREFYNVTEKKGDFLDSDGNVLGVHNGAIDYTIGQRRGLNVSVGHRIYVLGKNMEKNTVTLGEESQLYSSRVYVNNVNMVAIERLTCDINVEAKLRYSKKSDIARLIPVDSSSAILEFKNPQRAVTTGQAAVFYDGEAVIGGGIISIKE